MELSIDPTKGFLRFESLQRLRKPAGYSRLWTMELASRRSIRSIFSESSDGCIPWSTREPVSAYPSARQRSSDSADKSGLSLLQGPAPYSASRYRDIRISETGCNESRSGRRKIGANPSRGRQQRRRLADRGGSETAILSFSIGPLSHRGRSGGCCQEVWCQRVADSPAAVARLQSARRPGSRNSRGGCGESEFNRSTQGNPILVLKAQRA